MRIGKLTFEPAEDHLELLAGPVQTAVQGLEPGNTLVSAIDDALSDTAAFCEHYDIGLDISANCVIVEAKRGERTWYAACMILATDRIDVNGAVRRQLDARKISFAPMDQAVEQTGIMYGGITPIGLPAAWPMLVDSRVASKEWLVIGGGLRSSKLLIRGSQLATLSSAVVLGIAKQPA